METRRISVHGRVSHTTTQFDFTSKKGSTSEVNSTPLWTRLNDQTHKNTYFYDLVSYISLPPKAENQAYQLLSITFSLIHIPSCLCKSLMEALKGTM